MKTEIAITGATGFIGSKLIKKLGADNNITCLSRKKVDGYETIIGDLRNWNKDITCDILIHCASACGKLGQTHDEIWETNVNGTIRLLNHVKSRHYVLLSTISTAGYGFHTDFECHPHDVYSLTKTIQEYLFRRENHLITRIVQVYGPGMDYGIYRFVDMIKHGLIFTIGRGDNLFHTIYIDNLIDALVLLIENKKTGMYYVGDEKITTIREFTEITKNIYGKNRNIIELPVLPMKVAGEICGRIPPLRKRLINPQRVKTFTENLAADVTPLIKEGFRSDIQLDEGLRRYVKWIDKRQIT